MCVLNIYEIIVYQFNNLKCIIHTIPVYSISGILFTSNNKV